MNTQYIFLINALSYFPPLFVHTTWFTLNMAFAVKLKTLKAALTWTVMLTGSPVRTHPGILSHSSSVNLPSYSPTEWWTRPAELEVVWLLCFVRRHSLGLSNISDALWRYVPEKNKISTDLTGCKTGNSSFLARKPPVYLTLATVACVEPWAIPGAHCRVYTWHSGRVNLRVFTGLREVCQVILCVA